MYDDRRETFSIKDIFLQLLFIILLVFILIWLFPTKGYLERKLDGIESGIDEKLKPLYTRLFTDNIITMKDAAKSYFTTPRLPAEVGDKVKLTLKEMYEKGLLLEVVDSNNNSCDPVKSYVELTKTEEEYQMKVNLSCSDKEAYIIEYMGCYDYCQGKLCTKEEAKIVTPAPKYSCRIVDGKYWGKNYTVVDEATYKKQCTNPEPTYTCKIVNGKYWGKNATVVDKATYEAQCETEKKYEYEYVLQVGGKCTAFGKWGEWTTNKIDASDNTKVETKTEKVVDHYEQVYKVIDTVYKDVEYTEDVNYGYSTKTIKKTATYDYTTKTTDTVLSFATKTYKTVASYDYIYETVDNGDGKVSTIWEAAGTTTSKKQLVSNATTRYTETGRETKLECAGCETVTIYSYIVEKAKTVTTPGTTTTVKKCPNGTTEKADKTGCEIVTEKVEKYCPQGNPTDGGCVVSNTEKYCAVGTENATKTGCEVVTYEKQNYCALNGKENATKTGCVIAVKKTKKVAELVYGYVDGDPVYKDVTYYRSATRTCTEATTDYKWSLSNNDESLKSQGYKLTGKTREVK